MSLKDNFNQAIKEILKNDGLVGDDLSKGSRKKTEVDKFMKENAVPGGLEEKLTPSADTPPSDSNSQQRDNPPSAEDFRQAVQNRQNADPFAEGDEAGSPPPEPEPETYNRFEYQTAAESVYTPPPAPEPPPPPPPVNRSPAGYGGRSYGGGGGGGGYNPPRNPMEGAQPLRGGRPPETPYYETEETTIISRNTRINGDISSFANVNVEGSVQGDVKLTKNISVSGKVVGNIECNNAVMAGAQMQGSISSKGQVQIDHDSVLLGNVDTQYLDLNGRIKGNVDVGGKAEFKNDAVIVGDITASTISVIDGAVIKGYVNTTFMQESTSNVFPEAISVGEM